VLVMAGSFATKAKAAIEVLRKEGKRVGLLRLRMIRPWPGSVVAAALANRRAVAGRRQKPSPRPGGRLLQENDRPVVQKTRPAGGDSLLCGRAGRQGYQP